MRLHLPKGLLAALLAACFALPAGAATTVTVGDYRGTFDSLTTGSTLPSSSTPAYWVTGTDEKLETSDATSLNKAGTIILGDGSYEVNDAGTTSVAGKQLFLQGWGHPTMPPAINITSSLVIGKIEKTNSTTGGTEIVAALRFGGDGNNEVKVSGDITIAEDAKFEVSGTRSVISGNITGAGKTLTLTKSNSNGTFNLTGEAGKSINLGGLTITNGVTIVLNYQTSTNDEGATIGGAKIGDLNLSGAAFTNSGSLTIGGEGKTLTLGTVLGGDGTVEIKESTTVNISDVVLRPLLSSGGEEEYNDTQNNGFSRFTSTTADLSRIITISNLTLGNNIVWKNGTDEITYSNGVLSGLSVETTKYYIVNESVTWSDATGATALWVAENLTVTGDGSVPPTVTEFDISAGSILSMDSLSGAKTVNGKGKLSVGTLSDTTTISGSGHIDITGNISLSDKSLTLQNSAAGSMVTFYGTNALKMIDMKGQSGVTAHLTLAAGSSTTLVYPTDNGQGLWMSGTSTLDIRMKDDGLSKEGGKLIFGTNATISATDRNASISSTGDKYTFEATSFTLTDAEFRANATAAAITLKNKLVNAIVVNDSSNDLTIENAENTLRGVDASGGNIKFAANAKVTGSIKIADGKSVIVNSGAVLTHDGFSYEDSTIKTADSAHDLSLVNNAVITGGTLTQTANISDTVQYKAIQSSLTDVKLVNTTSLELHLESDASLSGMDIGGKLQVNSATTVSGASSVSGTVEVTSGKSLTMESTATLSGKGTLKNSGGTITVKDASGFTGTLEATGGQMNVDLTDQGSAKKLVGLTADGGGINVTNASSLTVADVVISNDSTVGVYRGADTSEKGTLNVCGSNTDKSSLTIGSGATLNANLVVNLAILDFSGNALAMGSTLTLIAGSTSELLNIPALSAGQSLTLFTGVDSFSTSWDPAQATTDVVTVDAHEIFGNLTTGTYSLKYTGAAAGGDVLLIANNPTPEPTTATLSLLALMGLAARRRRRKA